MADDLLGSWVRAGGVTGVVSGVHGDTVSVFEPSERRMATVQRADVEPVPAAAVRVTLTVDLPLPHGVGEDSLRRWVGALTDPVLRERAQEALQAADQDIGAALPTVDVTLTPSEGPAAVCLCGARTDPQGAASVRCASCGRVAVAPPRR